MTGRAHPDMSFRCLVARDQLVGRIYDLLIEPPATHRAVGIIVGLRGKRDVVALP